MVLMVLHISLMPQTKGITIVSDPCSKIRVLRTKSGYPL